MAEHLLALLAAVMVLAPGPAPAASAVRFASVRVQADVIVPREPIDAPVADGFGGPIDDGDIDEPVPEPSPGPDAPSVVVDAVDDVAQTSAGATVRISYAENDTYIEQVEPTITTPAAGEAVIVGGADPHIVYTPGDAAAPGVPDTFSYTVCSLVTPDACDTAQVTVDIIAAADMQPPQTGAGDVIENAGPTAPQTCQEPLEWGGHRNGRIPDVAMTAIGGGHRLMTEAADAFTAMRDAAAGQGVQIRLTDSYRSFAAQVRVRQQKGGVVATATPGTSVHGWGKALDINVRDPGVRSWLEANSRAYAWINPPWAKRPGKSFEPWHYEYYGVDVDPGNAQCAGIGAALTGQGGTGGSEPAVEEGALLSGSLAVQGRSVGFGLGALTALLVAAVIVARDVQRGRAIHREPPP